MGVRPFLPVPIDARAQVLFHVGRRAQTAIALNRKDRNVTARVVRDQNKFSSSIDRHVTGAGAQRRLLVQQPELAGLLIDGKGRDGAAPFAAELMDFVDCIEVAKVSCESKKRWINYLPGRPHMF